MRKRHLHIHRLISVLLLWVFAIALTPFGAFHGHDHDHHEVKCSTTEKSCTHKLHIGTQTEHCLICEAHFEKNYTTARYYISVFLLSKPVTKVELRVSSSYVNLIDLALRGPPQA